MNRVWITRTEPGASRFADVMREAGFDPVVAPVLTIARTGEVAPRGRFDTAVFVSEHAACYAGELTLDSETTLVAIGRATRTELERQGRRVAVTEPSSDALIARWQASETRALLERLVLVKGEGGRETLPVALARYSELTVWDAYRRETKTVARPDSLDAIVCSSGDGVRAMALADEARNQSLPLIVPSARVAAIAVELGYRNTHITQGAAVDVVVACLRQLGRRKTNG